MVSSCKNKSIRLPIKSFQPKNLWRGRYFTEKHVPNLDIMWFVLEPWDLFYIVKYRFQEKINQENMESTLTPILGENLSKKMVSYLNENKEFFIFNKNAGSFFSITKDSWNTPRELMDSYNQFQLEFTGESTRLIENVDLDPADVFIYATELEVDEFSLKNNSELRLIVLDSKSKFDYYELDTLIQSIDSNYESGFIINDNGEPELMDNSNIAEWLNRHSAKLGIDGWCSKKDDELNLITEIMLCKSGIKKLRHIRTCVVDDILSQYS